MNQRNLLILICFLVVVHPAHSFAQFKILPASESEQPKKTFPFVGGTANVSSERLLTIYLNEENSKNFFIPKKLGKTKITVQPTNYGSQFRFTIDLARPDLSTVIIKMNDENEICEISLKSHTYSAQAKEFFGKYPDNSFAKKCMPFSTILKQHAKYKEKRLNK